MKITLGAGVANPHGFRYDAEDLAQKFHDDEAKPELWWSPHVWQDDRRSAAAWESAGAIAVDVDAHALGKKVVVDPWLDVIEQGFEFGVLPGSIYHSTPHGFRLIFVLAATCTDRNLYRAAASGAMNLVRKAIPELELEDEVDLDVDPISDDLARLFYHPSAVVDGKPRKCRTLEHRDDDSDEIVAFDVVALGCVVPPAPPAALPAPPPPPPPSLPPPMPKPVAGDVKAAALEWISTHPKARADLDAAIASRICPACEHRDCFDPMLEGGVANGKAVCRSTNHGADAPGVGQPYDRVHVVDALDLFAHRAARAPIAILLEAGLIEGDEPPPVPEDGRAVVMLSRDEPHPVTVGEFADAVLAALPRDLLFRAGGKVGAIRVDGDDVRHTDVNGTEAVMLAEDHVEFRTHRYNAGTKSYQIVRSNPKRGAGIAVVERARTSRDVDDLQGVYTTPTFAGDFDLLRPGFNATTGLFYREPESLRGLRPNIAFDRNAARAMLLDYLSGFADVVDAIGLSHAVALIVTLVVRPSLPIVPLFATFSTTEGSGKTTLVDDFCGRLVQGRQPPHLRSMHEEELPKTLFAHARSGTSFCVLDNVRDGSNLDSPLLAELVTSANYDARVLGVSTIERPRNLFTIAATGNNVSLSPEITRRSVPITFRPKVVLAERSFERSPAEQVAKFRRPILELVLGAVERWKTAGRPKHPSGRALDGFPEWSHAVGGVLGMLGLDEFLDGIEQFRATANTWDDAARSFLSSWYGSSSILNTTTVRALVELVEDDPTSLGIHATTDRGVQTALAMKVRSMAGRPSLLPYSVQVVNRGKTGGARYKVSKATDLDLDVVPF